MTPESSLADLAKQRQPLRYKMVIESTDSGTIRDALPMFPNAILITTPRGLLLAVPVTPENNSETGLDF